MTTSTAWGKATVRDHVTIPQSTEDGRQFATLIELLEGPDGETLVRFAYSTGGTARRGPVTLRPADIHKLKKQLEKKPELAAALAWVDPALFKARETKAARPR